MIACLAFIVYRTGTDLGGDRNSSARGTDVCQAGVAQQRGGGFPEEAHGGHMGDRRGSVERLERGAMAVSGCDLQCHRAQERLERDSGRVASCC
jgi:hypothetical protein